MMIITIAITIRIIIHFVKTAEKNYRLTNDKKNVQYTFSWFFLRIMSLFPAIYVMRKHEEKTGICGSMSISINTSGSWYQRITRWVWERLCYKLQRSEKIDCYRAVKTRVINKRDQIVTMSVTALPRRENECKNATEQSK